MATNVMLAMMGAATGILSGRLLGPRGRGELAAIQNIPTVLASVCMLGMPEAVVFHTSRRRQDASKIVGTAVLIALSASILAAVLALPLLPHALRAQSPDVIREARIYLSICPLFALVWLPFHLLRGAGRLIWWNAFRLMPSLTWLLILLAVPKLTMVSPERLATANLIGTALMGIPIWIVVRITAGKPIRPQRGYATPLIRFGAPAAATTLPQLLNFRLDQLVLAAFLSPDSLGLYAVAVGWSFAATPVLFAIGYVLFPQLAASEQEAGREKLIRAGRLGAVVAVVTCSATVAITPIAFPILLGPKFAPAIPAAIVMSVAATFTGLSFILEEGLRGLNRQGAVVRAELAGLMVIAISLTPLLHYLGILGAAISSLIGYGTTLAYLATSVARSRPGPVDSDRFEEAEYRVVRLYGSPIIALPVRPRSAVSVAARRLQGFSLKRRLTYGIIRSTVATGLVRAVRRTSSESLGREVGVDLAALAREFQRETGLAVANAAVIWPWPPSSVCERLYIHWLRADAVPLGFTKVALSEVYAERLTRESNFLKALAGRNLGRTLVPQILAESRSDQSTALTVTAIPVSARPFPAAGAKCPTWVIESYAAGTHLRAELARVRELPWWRDLSDEAGPTHEVVAAAESTAASRGLNLCLVHGDFEAKNLLEDQGRLWLVDWEWAEELGPVLADRVRFEISQRGSQCARDPAKVLRNLREAALRERWSAEPEVDLGIALAFLALRRCPEARPLLAAWTFREARRSD